MELKNKVVAITGAGGGLGRATAVTLASQGCALALIDLKSDALEQTARECEQVGSNDVAIFTTNVVDEQQVTDTFAAIGGRFGKLHGLINNAGITRDGFTLKATENEITHKMSLQQWQQVIDVNLTGVFLCGREAAALMITTQCTGCIVNISSISRAGNKGQINYSATKAGVEAMSVVWAKEFARYRIRSAAIAPGFIATDMVMGMKAEARDKMTGPIPVGRMGEPHEIASAIKFVLENDYVNGRCFEIDGGLRF
ncbi:MAG: SDR family oxidoreductase [Gammaproteobacteria bacterium]